MNLSSVKYLLFALVDTYFAVIFFSERAAQLLPFLIAPFVFILFLAFFQNPQSFIRQWNSWLAQILKFSSLLVGAYIFFKFGHFPVLNDFLTKNSWDTYVYSVGAFEGLLFVFLAIFSQIGFIIGIIFNLLAFSFPNKFSESAKDHTMTFFIALIPTIIFTLIFTLAIPYIGSLVAQ